MLENIESYLGSKLNHGLAVASAKALGNVGDPKAVDCLNQLMACFREAELVREAVVRHAIGRVEGREKVTEIHCPVCSLPIEKDEGLLKCPNCGVLARKGHLLEWLHVKGYCPSCHKHLEGRSLKQAKQAYLFAKSARRSTGRKSPRAGLAS